MIKAEPLILFLVGMRFHLLFCMNTFGSLTQSSYFSYFHITFFGAKTIMTFESPETMKGPE